MKKVKPIPEEIKEYLSYDEYTGNLHWIKKTSKRTNIGDITGSINSYGYIVVKFKGLLYKAHRIVWYLKTGKQPTKQIDHINCNKADNSWDNLREADANQNMHNIRKRSNNKSGFKGVSLHKASGKWVTHITVNSKSQYLGYFDSPKEAHEAYCLAADKLYGNFANFG